MSSALSPARHFTPPAHRLARRAARMILALGAVLSCLLAVPHEASAQNLIKRPGAHNRYDFEFEIGGAVRTHLPWGGYRGDFDGRRWRGNAAGFGPNIRVSIPFMHNGPIDTINNNIGISFGVATTWHSCCSGFSGGYDAFATNVPVLFQWNFYFTKIISVVGEVGANSVFTVYDFDDDDRWTNSSSGVDFDIEPMFNAGGRFQFGTVGVIVRVGWPLMSVGANFQF